MTSEDLRRPAGQPLARARVSDRIVDELRDRIADGTYPRGGKLPTERELAQDFGVSSPTIREALRALTSLGIVQVRHGSGAYVSGTAQPMIRAALGLLVQMDNVQLDELVGLLRVLNLYVADSAIDKASQADLDRMRAAADLTGHAETAEEMVGAVQEFLVAYVAVVRQPLLAALCGFLISTLVEIEQQALSTKPPSFLIEWGRSTAPFRHAVVDAFETGNRKKLHAAVEDLHAQIQKRIAGVPELLEARLHAPTTES